MAGTLPSAPVLMERMVARLRLRHLRLLAALERCATLGEAAREVGVTQPAASQMLRELESTLEVQLFERHSRGLRATDAGHLLAQQSRQVLGSMRYGADALAALASQQQRPLQIAAIPSAVVGLVRPRLAQLRSRLRGLKVLVDEDLPESVMVKLMGGQAQLALVRRPDRSTSPGLVFEELLADDLVVVATPRHPMARRKSVDLADLATAEWSMPQGQISTAAAFARACETAGFTPRRADVQCMSPDLLPSLTSDGRTLAAMPRSVAGALLERGEVVELRLRERIELPPIGALFHAHESAVDVATVLAVLRDEGTDSRERLLQHGRD
ncbi:LysR family transcriptional regulator [Variovorax terrae]|uniref:LysR family transcriptional regulator n=1 Tax=Variovorax terrae TaxID=2923278 RepID=A0A9X1W5J4_9BURK|nr:LysR family transcriptional regulator [Variovorax terrae]MCJ0766148.1 LysR family transcriptional regulator [Variovorax terrae]